MGENLSFVAAEQHAVKNDCSSSHAASSMLGTSHCEKSDAYWNKGMEKGILDNRRREPKPFT